MLFLLFGGILVILASFSLTTPFQELVLEKLETYTQNFPEKVYVLTDKPYYTLGDDMWFATYLVNGIDHTRTTKSKIVYVELINAEDSLVAKRRLYVDDINTAGEFALSKDWKPGNYMLRAYTNYMRNDNQDYFFKKQISIWDARLGTVDNQLNETDKQHIPSQRNNEKANQRPLFNFYPEGGYLVEGLPSKVAVKIEDPQYHDLEFQGIVKDSDDKTVSAFKTYKYGLGALLLTPEVGKSYYAVISINGKEERYQLPQALPAGFNLAVLTQEQEIILKVSTTEAIGLQNAFVLIHQRGKVVFEKLIESSSDKFTIKLNTSNMNSGVTSITLFNNNGKPVCERLFFIDNLEGNAAITVNQSKEKLSTREQVALQVAVKDKDAHPVSAKLSLVISDLKSVQKNYNDDNIQTYLLLNSDLRGEIADPGYFFAKAEPIKRKYLLDLVMLTHGWRRFTWNKLLYSPPRAKAKSQTEKGLFITGKTYALKEKNKAIPAATRLTFIEKGQLPFQELQQAGENGEFRYGPYVFFDSIPTLVEARVKEFDSDYSKNRDVHINIQRESHNHPTITRNNLLRKSNINQTTIENFLEQSQNISLIDSAYSKYAERLQEIVITAKRRTAAEERNNVLDNLTNYGTPSRRLDVASLLGAESLNIFTLLNRLPGVFATNNSIRVRGGTPQILLDGFRVEIEDISFLSGFDVEFIDLLTGAAATLSRSNGNGVIAIYTRTGGGSIANAKKEPGIINFKYPGFYTAREFFAPNYADSFADASKKDIRTTLHWEPSIKITENGSAEVKFFTSDVKGDYAVEIEGITNTGIPIYHKMNLSVE